ncbi:hypothetical protein BFG04_05805 [Campylobacter pinnipediorum subsp. pinnipediorum]|uniref:beta-lactamase n=1 Tax=Campylobacter pinnipediorum subsp. pinnipediorum TaxID=1660067 RepID=A0AAX0L903_9BACT|nr:tetratricopeptide repeat protein [Campylobacter pinnipediorum]OPA75001.1 hypothetical protein BFG04_05805 [Campylobacter pinnipediorum subsp. pinnipediorum]
MKFFYFLFFILLSLFANDDELLKEAQNAYKNYDCAKAEKLYKQLANKNNPDAIFTYAWLLEKGECVKRDYAEARKYYELGIKSDDVNVQKLSNYRLGLLLIANRGGDEDESNRVLSLWGTAERLGYFQASLAIGMLYLRGNIVEQNDKLAREYFNRACDNDIKEACTIISNLKIK